MSILKGLIDKKTLSVLSLFTGRPDEFFHINKVAEESGVALATAFRIIRHLDAQGIIIPVKISKFKIYKLADTSRTKELRRLL